MRRRKKRPPAAGSWLVLVAAVAAAAVCCRRVDCDMGAAVIPSGQVVASGEDSNSSSTTTNINNNKSSKTTGGEPLVVGASSRAALACLAAHEPAELEAPAGGADAAPLLVLWFKDEQPAPIYTLDARQSAHLGDARHYASSRRLRLDASRAPHLWLLIEPAEARDSARYRCRVDFRRAPTVSRQVRLLVQVPASRLEIRHVVVAGPDDGQVLREDASAHFACLALDGSPPPQLHWLIKWANESEPAPVEADARLRALGLELAEIRPQDLEAAARLGGAGEFVTASRLTFRRLARPLHQARLYCRASQRLRQVGAGANYRHQQPSPSITGGQSQSNNSEMIDGVGAHNELARAHQLASSLELELRLRPQWVEIVAEPAAGAPSGGHLSEGEGARLVCRSRGSHPPARLAWRWAPESAAPEPLPESPATGLGAPNATSAGSSSAIRLQRLGPRHHLAKLQCRADNPELKGEQPLWATFKLHVKYKPLVRLVELGAARGQSNQSRLLECRVQSNPPINQLVWLANGRPLTSLRPPASQTSQAEGEPGDCELLNWRTAPATAAALGPGEAQALPPWLALDPCKRLAVIRPDDKLAGEKYKCSAINIMGETSSPELEPEWEYPPRCLAPESPAMAPGALGAPQETEEPLQRLQSQLARAPRARHALACPLEARPPPAAFEWWLVRPAALAEPGLGSLADLNSSHAFRRVATERNELGGEPLAQALAERALVLCRARNSLGWQEAACPQLPETSTEARSPAPANTQPPAANCSLEAHETRRADGQHQLELQLLCPDDTHRELLFQLAARLRDKDGGKDEPTLAFSPRLLAAGQRLALVELLADRKWTPQPDMGQRRSNEDGGARTKLSLGEQLELLPRLVFHVRSSDLRQISAPNAIYGHQVRPTRHELKSVHLQQQESAAQPQSAIMLEDQPQLANIRQRQQPQVVEAPTASSISGAARRSAAQSGDGAANGSGAATSTQVGPGGAQLRGGGGVFGGFSWSQRRIELAVAACATGGTLLLSALTLTLIVLLLRAKRGGAGNSSSSQRPYATAAPSLRLEETRLPMRDAAGGDSNGDENLARLTNGGNNWIDKSQKQQPDFMAPPVLSTTSTLNTRLAPAHIERHAQPETLYVIEGDSLARASGISQIEAEIESPASLLTSDELRQLCRTELLHVQKGGGQAQQQLLSYCSPTTCASSLTHCDELSELAQAQPPAQFVRLCGNGGGTRRTAQRNSAEEDDCATELTASQCSSSDFHQHHHLPTRYQQQQQQQQPLPSGAAYIEIKGPPVIIKGSGSGQDDLGDKSDSLYLFSFL